MKPLRWVTRDRWLSRRAAPSVFDWLLVLALLVIALLEVSSGVFAGPVAIAALVQVASLLPIAFRRVAPLPAIAISALAYLPYVVVFGAPNSLAQLLAGLLLLFSVGRYTDARGLLTGAAIGLLLVLVESLGGTLSTPADWAFAVAFSGAALCLGVALRVQEERSVSLTKAADQAWREQEATAKLLVQEERARIARELHDVVAHNVGLIVLQAGGARSVLATDPERARVALRQVEETGRQTLSEMRHMVGILRTDDDGLRQPLPSLARLPALIDDARASGLTVDLDVQGQPMELSAGLELAVYRLIQESLTNVRKHAPAARAAVRLLYEPDRVRIVVSDDGARAASAFDAALGASGPGHGLVGMRERVEMYGGRVQAGPTPGRGFRVEAILPFPGVVA